MALAWPLSMGTLLHPWMEGLLHLEGSALPASGFLPQKGRPGPTFLSRGSMVLSPWTQIFREAVQMEAVQKEPSTGGQH